MEGINISPLLGIVLICTGSTFFIAAFAMYLLRLNPEKAKSMTAKLVGFRQYYASRDSEQANYSDSDESSRGARPVFAIPTGNKDDMYAFISAEHSNKKLSKTDVGKTFPVLYQRKLGYVLVQNEEDILRKYNRKKTGILWAVATIGTAMVLAGLLLAAT